MRVASPQMGHDARSNGGQISSNSSKRQPLLSAGVRVRQLVCAVCLHLAGVVCVRRHNRRC